MGHAVFQTLPASGRMERHRHARGYAALVLSGGYTEAGDRGRFLAGPGHVLIHGDWESHMDAMSGSGARVINLPLEGDPGFGIGRIGDPDAIARAAETDPVAAMRRMLETLEPVEATLGDWPDDLAAALRRNPAGSLAVWAALRGLAPETVSRGFRRAYGLSPRRYRAEQRALLAVRALRRTDEPPASLAASLGFADQAHMTRAVRALTGATPGRLRIKSVQSGGVPPA